MEGIETSVAPGPVLGRDAILAQRNTPRVVETVEAFGGTVRVQALTAKEKDAFDASLIVGSGKRQKVETKNIRARLAARSIVDESGALVFTDDDADKLGDLSGADMQRIYDKAQELSGISDDDVEELAGN